jgi:hypothetical protein
MKKNEQTSARLLCGRNNVGSQYLLGRAQCKNEQNQKYVLHSSACHVEVAANTPEAEHAEIHLH